MKIRNEAKVDVTNDLSTEILLRFQQACIMDVCALKPGNVGFHASGHQMCARDFMQSVAACGQAICQPELTLGQRILHAVQATQLKVNCNTNLGIVLLCAPVIQAIVGNDAAGDSLRQRIEAVLDNTDIADARDVFAAIRLAKPGGMGKVSRGDIASAPQFDLRTVMGFAQERDLIAQQYITGYQFIFERIIPQLLEFRSHYGYDCWAVTGTYLMVLGSCPDSLITRKYGAIVSGKVSQQISSLLDKLAEHDVHSQRFRQFEQELLELDKNLKRECINPGTTADLVVASLFIVSLEGHFA